LNGCGRTLATAVCCAFPAKPAHSIPAPEPRAAAFCALAAGVESQEPSTSPIEIVSVAAVVADLGVLHLMQVLIPIQKDMAPPSKDLNSDSAAARAEPKLDSPVINRFGEGGPSPAGC